MLQKKLNLVVLRIDKKQHFKMITFKSQKLILLLEYDEVVFYLYHVRKKRSKRKKGGGHRLRVSPLPPFQRRNFTSSVSTIYFFNQ